MKEKLRRQQLRMMLYNLIAFTLIFALFGFILYGQIRRYLIEPIGADLFTAMEHIREEPDFVARQLSFSWENAPFRGWQEDRDDRQGEHRDPPWKAGGGRLPMRIQVILRDSGRNVVNPAALGHIYFEGYLQEIPVAGDHEKHGIIPFSVGGEQYISLTFDLPDAEGARYTVQLVTNVDGEYAILENFTRLLVLCVIVFVLLSLLASYVLSKKTMEPILLAWNRQTEFVGNASHELRTPLTIIQNKLEAMLTQPQATVMDKAGEIGVSLSETRRLSRLTADLMTLARADSSETQLELQSFNPDELIASVCEPYGELAELQEKTMRLELDCGAPLPADKLRVHELMVILLDNALKYTHAGDEIIIRTALREGRIVIEVEDTGAGISEDLRERVFDRFYRADKARGRESGGSGLGLSIAKWIVDAHQGSISVHPGSRGGALFRVKFKTR